MKKVLFLILICSQFSFAQTEEKNKEKIRKLMGDYLELFNTIGDTNASNTEKNKAQLALKDLFTSVSISVYNDLDTSDAPGFTKIADYVRNIDKTCPHGYEFQLLMPKAEISETKVNYSRNIYMSTVEVKKMVQYPIITEVSKDSISLDSVFIDSTVSIDTIKHEYTDYDTTHFKRVYNLVFYLQAIEQYDIFTGYQIFAIALKGTQPELEPLTGLNKWWVELDNEWKEVFKKELNLNEAPKPYYLQRIKGMRTLNMNDSKITSLEPISEFTSLVKLECKNTGVTTLEPIKNITSLKYIDVSESKLDTLLGLEKMVNLEMFFAHDVDIVDISFLKNSTQMVELDLSGNYIEEISALQGMTLLEKLDLGTNKISDITPLKNLVNLTELNLEKNLVEDIQVLSGMTMMIKLNLFNNPIPDLNALARLTKITHLDIGYCNAKTMDPIKNMRYLMFLNITGIKANDFSALGNFTLLRELNVSRTSISSLDIIMKHEYMQSLVMINTKIPVKEKDRYKKKNPKVKLTYY